MARQRLPSLLFHRVATTNTITWLPGVDSIRTVRSPPLTRYLHQSPPAKSIYPPRAITLRGTTIQSPPLRNTIALASNGPPALSLLDVPTLLRSYLISTVSSNQLLLSLSLRLLTFLAHSSSPVLAHNRVFHYVLKKTLYKHFCAGETPLEAQQTVTELKKIGFKGVILASAKEIVLDEQPAVKSFQAEEAKSIEAWKNSALETVRLAESADYVALKYYQPHGREETLNSADKILSQIFRRWSFRRTTVTRAINTRSRNF